MIIYIPDSNIFISNPKFIPNLLKLIEPKRSAIFIPFIVVQELEGLQKSEKTSVNARIAVKFLQQALLTLNGIHWQKIDQRFTPTDSNVLITNDDQILDCCLFAKLHITESVFLLTGDKNLSLKAAIHGIVVPKISSVGSLLEDCGSGLYLERDHEMDIDLEENENLEVGLEGGAMELEMEDVLLSLTTDFTREISPLLLKILKSYSESQSLHAPIIHKKDLEIPPFPWSILDIVHVLNGPLINVKSSVLSEQMAKDIGRSLRNKACSFTYGEMEILAHEFKNLLSKLGGRSLT